MSDFLLSTGFTLAGLSGTVFLCGDGVAWFRAIGDCVTAACVGRPCKAVTECSLVFLVSGLLLSSGFTLVGLSRTFFSLCHGDFDWLERSD